MDRNKKNRMLLMAACVPILYYCTVAALSLAGRHSSEVKTIHRSAKVELDLEGELVYKRLGIDFTIIRTPEMHSDGKVTYKMGVNEVIISPPEPEQQSTQTNKLDVNAVMPGVGAYGVCIGDKRDDVLKRLGPAIDRAPDIHPNGLQFHFNRYKSMDVIVLKGKAYAFYAFGPFVTPEGISENSTVRDILKAYGQPDVYYTWPQ
jgi:hypothetical protein